MSTFVYMTRCDGCGHCVDICPSDIMHIDENIRRAKNIEPNFCWECYSCVKACPNHAIDVRGYADFAPMGHSVRVRREEEKGTISWKIKFRNGTEKNFVSPITTKPWENLVRSSNMKDYGSFTRDFSTQMLFGANEVELGKQWANNDLITNLNETYEPFGTLRRGEHITILIKQTNKKIPGEFLGRLVLGVEDDAIKVFGATIY